MHGWREKPATGEYETRLTDNMAVQVTGQIIRLVTVPVADHRPDGAGDCVGGEIIGLGAGRYVQKAEQSRCQCVEHCHRHYAPLSPVSPHNPKVYTGRRLSILSEEARGHFSQVCLGHYIFNGSVYATESPSQCQNAMSLILIQPV
jgi:hypothetical protein